MLTDKQVVLLVDYAMSELRQISKDDVHTDPDIRLIHAGKMAGFKLMLHQINVMQAQSTNLAKHPESLCDTCRFNQGIPMDCPHAEPMAKCEDYVHM